MLVYYIVDSVFQLHFYFAFCKKRMKTSRIVLVEERGHWESRGMCLSCYSLVQSENRLKRRDKNHASSAIENVLISAGIFTTPDSQEVEWTQVSG